MKQDKKRILVVAAHSDDETLGCGGAMARHVAEGDAVHVIFLTDGVGARSAKDPGAKDSNARSKASKAALAALGVPELNVHAFSFPDNALDSISRLEIVKAIESVLDAVQPEIIYSHHAGDLNIDHRYAYEATMTACRPQPGNSVKEIYSYEVPSSTAWAGLSFERAFIPTKYIAIEVHWKQKAAALQAYADEMRPFPHARSLEAVEALTKFRGSQIGVSRAEAFVVERIIQS